MPCKNPLLAYRGKGNQMCFRRSQAIDASTVHSLPCGKCIECRLSRSRDWALRCTHETQLHDENCFITLTYDEEHLPWDESITKPTFQKFMKRLRKETRANLRYFACGEYGEKTNRPHYHALIFGYDFPDKQLFSNGTDSNRLYISPTLEKCWPFGFSSVGEANFDTARYVAGYIHKKIIGKDSDDHYRRYNRLNGEEYTVEPEFQLQSNKPGIGRGWYDKYANTDLWPKRYTTIGNKKYPAPRYYWDALKAENPALYELLKDAQDKDVEELPELSARRLGEIAEAKEINYRKKMSNKI